MHWSRQYRFWSKILHSPNFKNFSPRMKPGKFCSELKLDYLLQEIPLKNYASNVTNHRAVNYSDKNKNDITTHTSESS